MRKEYNISDNETLFINKIDIIQEGMRIPKIEFDVYSKLFGKNLTKLNLSICENSKMSLSVPVEITENLDKLNMSSDYFNDLCYKASSEGGTDIILNDRKNEFIEGNKTVCQEDCNFSDYYYDIKIANCSCKIKESSSSYSEMNINKTKLYENFDEINNDLDLSNKGILSCNIISSTENIESNTGFYLLLIILILFVIVFIIFCSKGFNLLENKMGEVIHKKFKNEKKTKKNKIKNSFINKDIIQPRRKQGTKSKSKKSKRSANKSKNANKSLLYENKNKKRGSNNISSLLENKNKSQNKKETSKDKPETDYELNWLPNEAALKFDKRSSCEYYGSLIRYKQLFIFTFCSFTDYNSGVIKKFMLFLSFALHYTVNSLFFTESNIHQIYEDKGKFNFEYQIKFIIYSAIISTAVMRLMLHFLVLTDKDVLEVKKQHTKDMAINMKKKKLKCMKIKFAIFFVLNFILLGLFWYYLTCFNAIYENTQIYLIENTFISFGFSLFYPFIINIFPIMIRMGSIHSSKKDQKYIYKLSQIIQLI